MENKTPEEKVIIKYSSYTPAQKRATQKYRQNNKEKVNEQRKKYYQARKEKDPDFLEYKRIKAKEYYQKKKNNKESEKIIEHVEEHIQEPLIEQQEKIQEPEVIECIKPKKKRLSKKKEIIISPEVLEEAISQTELAKIIEETIASAPEVPKKKRASKKKSKEV